MDCNWKLFFQLKTIFLLPIFLTGISQTKAIPHTESLLDNSMLSAGSAFVIPQAQLEGMSLTYVSNDESCPGKNDGSIDLTIANASSVPQIQWSTGETTEDLSGLAAGTYDVTVTDGSETASLSITIGNNPAPVAAITGDAVACQNTDKVPFTIQASGGIPPYVANFTYNGGLTLQTPSFTDEITMYQSTTNTGTYQYELVSIVDGNGCEYPVSGEVTIEVTNGATLDNPGDLEFCQGETTTPVALTGSPGNVVFDITGGASIGLNDKTGVSQIPSFTAMSGSATLTITPRANGCSGVPGTVQVTVSPKADLSVSQVLETICTGATTNIKLSSTTSGATFEWSVLDITPTGSISGSGDDTGNILAQTLVNTSNEVATVTYRITSYKNGCEGSSLDIEVQVLPELQATIEKTANSCQNESSPEVIFTAIGGEAPYLFTYRINGGTEQTVTESSGNAATISVPTGTAGDFTYELISVEDKNGCPSSVSESVTVTISEKPVLTSGLNPQGICSNEVFTYVPTSDIPGTTFSWSRAEVAGISNPAASGTDDPDEYLENTTNDPIAVTYTYTLSADGCSNTQDVVVIVTKKPELTSSLTPPDICSGTTFSYTPTSDISGTDYPWTRAAVAGIANPATSGTGNPNEVLINTTSNPIGVTYLYTLNSNGCENPVTYPVYVVVIPAPQVTVSASETEICPGESVDLYSSSDIASSLPSTLLSEDFNSGSAGDKSGLNSWTTYFNNNNAAWTIRDNNYNQSGKTFRSNDSSKFYLANSGAAGNTNITSTLTSPAINTVGYTSLELTFWHYYESGGNSDQPKIRVSTDNSNWTDIEEFTNSQGTSTDFVKYTVSLNGYVGNSTLYIQFYYKAKDDKYWAIDNVELTGEGSSVDMYWTSYPSGFSSTEQNPTNVYPTQTTDYIAWYTDPDTGCVGSDTVTVIVRETPAPEITADYCSYSPKILLTASDGYTSYLWSTGETTQSILVDLAAIYTVTVTDEFGCSGSTSFNTSTELLINGSFEDGNVGFVTPATSGNQYTYVADDPSVSSELFPEGLYGIGTNARNYHSNFWGVDHTTGTGNFMIVNGFPGSPQPIVWQETVTVRPNTDYYFSAWAISLNNSGNYASLQFSINGTQIGTVAQLTAGTSSSANPWKTQDRFYGMWNSGSNTTAVVSIVDLQTAAGGNDFGLDDISFGTLAPWPAEVDPTSAGDICQGGTISLYANSQYGREPITYLWTGPNGFSSTEENPVITNAKTANSGTYTVQVFDAYGCENESGSVNVTVYPTVKVNAGADQTVCYENAIVSLAGSVSGSATTGSWSGGSGTYSPNAQTLNASYTPSSAEIAAGTVTLTLTSDTPDGPCPAKSDKMKITVLQPLEISFTQTLPLCHDGDDGKLTASVTGGKSPYSYLWSDGQTTQTAIGLSAGVYSLTVTDAKGCSTTQSATLSEPSTFVVNPPSFSAPSCYGGTDGTATITATGGTPPYQFIWDAAAGSQTTSTATNLGAGTYSVIVLSDAHGCAATAVKVTIPEPEAPELTCPDDIYAIADEGTTYASNVIVTAPEYDTFCQSIEYEMTGATSDTGNGLVPSPSTFNVGTTTITYTAVNLKGEVIECSFRVIVSDTKPDITCADPISVNTDVDECSASVSVSLPTINSGTDISWSWTMTGATEDSGTGSIPDPYSFNKGVTTITWTAMNAIGSVQCSQTVTVTDNQAPEFTSPDPIEVCVEYLREYTYTNQIVPNYYTFENGNTLLDLNTASFSDNCGLSDCSPLIEWRIVFSDGSKLPASGYFTGQPSAYTNNGSTSFQFPGDNEGGSLLTHTIYYRITDCSNNVSSELSTTITVIPRPKIVQTP
ncbi:SprB-like repeat protein [Mangrovibacterium diazotrophicum]|uniref:SprB-like repeat protein n=2 Tax=Mangrovibacterium diazotrophicum TaxID=1261403 RepID=A0A419W8K1_9BACT|nr:SprB-like repeat protein [Mangrovibacterium diazotrophicum]